MLSRCTLFRSLRTSLLTLLAFCFTCSTVLCLTTPSPTFMVLDLNSNSANFINQASLWTVAGALTTATHSQCGGTYLLGGYNILDITSVLTRQYDNLAPHTSVFIKVRFWFIDEWSLSNYLYIIVANETQESGRLEMGYLSYDIATWPGNVCGDSSSDIPGGTLNVRINHSGSLIFTVNPQLHSVIPSYGQLGIRDVQIMVSNTTVPTSSFCIQTIPAGLMSSVRSCSCPDGYYLATDSTCQPCDGSCYTCSSSQPTDCLSCAPQYSFNGNICIQCDSSCETCSGTSNKECLTCPEGKYLSFDHTCVSACPSPLVPFSIGTSLYCGCSDPSSYLFSNGSCLATCPSPAFIAVEQFPVNLCNFQCATGYYLYLDGSCSLSCDAYYNIINEGGFKYCNYPCTGTNYLAWEGSCISDCFFPLTQVQKRGKNHCTYPCSSLQFLWYNTSCFNSCNSPYIQKAYLSKNFCNLPCGDNQYLFNGSCLSACDPPMVQLLSNDIHYCNRPCPSDKMYYYPENQGCKSTCVQPYTVDLTDMSLSCYLNLSASEAQQVQQIASVTAAASTATQSLTTASVLASSDPGGISTAMLAKMLMYIRYIDITCSTKLELSFKGKNATSGFLPWSPEMNTNLRSEFIDYPLPKRFATFGVYSSFFVNFWDGFISLGIVFGIWLAFRLLESISKVLETKFLPYSTFQKIRFIAQNFCITQFYGCYSDVAMFMVIEMQYGTVNSFASGMSFTLGILMLVFGLLAFGYHFRLLLQYQKIRNFSPRVRSRLRISKRKNPERMALFANSHEGLKVIFLNFKDDSIFQQSVFLILCFRNMIYSLIIGTLYEQPLAQACVISGLTILTTLYLLIKKPYKSIVSLIQQIFGELILLVANISVVGMAGMDYTVSDRIDLRDKFGEAILYCSIALNFVAPVFIVLKALEAIYTFYKLRKSRLRQRAQREKRKGQHELVSSERPMLNIEEKDTQTKLEFRKPAFPQRVGGLRLKADVPSYNPQVIGMVNGFDIGSQNKRNAVSIRFPRNIKKDTSSSKPTQGLFIEKKHGLEGKIKKRKNRQAQPEIK